MIMMMSRRRSRREELDDKGSLFNISIGTNISQ
jgi:hypothetical protein